MGYIYGYIDGALQTIGQDMADTSVGVPITQKILAELFPGKGDRWSFCSTRWATTLRYMKA